MVPVAVDLHASDNLLDFTIDTDIQIALATHRFEEFAIMSLSATY